MGEERKRIRIDEITVDPAIAVRKSTDEEIIERYAENLEDFPPIVVFHTGDKYLLADGFHRWAAAIRRGWEQIEAEVREGSYEEASEYAVTANLKHGKPLTSREYETALLRLKNLHPNWTQEKLATFLNRSRIWVSRTFAALNVETVCTVHKLDTATKVEISKAPKELWSDIGRVAQEQDWTRDETQKIVQTIKAEPSRAQEILRPQPAPLDEVPADKLIPLSKEIMKLCEKLEPELYNWGSGVLAGHVLQGLYVLGDKVVKMIEFLESKQYSHQR